MTIPPLDADLTAEVLHTLGVSPAPPDLALLDRLVAAYTRRVPWESAFRIARRAAIAETPACPRWPEIFWRDAIDKGGGGTCFESNYAFLRLLRALGYDGYLTVNNMGESSGCHSAVILWLGGERWLVDVGLPVFAVLPIRPGETTRRASQFFVYTVVPAGEGRYEIEREPHPQRNCYTLIDLPIDHEAYRQRTIDDYGEGGLFLDRVIVNKVLDERLNRFNGAEQPLRFEVFEGEQRLDLPIEGDAPAAIAARFGMDEATVRAAFAALEQG